MNKDLNELLKHVDTVTTQSGTKYKVTYFADNDSIEIRFKTQFGRKYGKDFIQVNDHGLHYWNNFTENYRTTDLAEMKVIIDLVFI